jgi:hypothetical protein
MIYSGTVSYGECSKNKKKDQFTPVDGSFFYVN